MKFRNLTTEMKKKITLAIALTAWMFPGLVLGQDPATEALISRDIEMRPNEKKALSLRPDEKNPYAQRAPDEGLSQEEEQNEEELAILSKLNSLRVTGSSRSARGLILLLGDIMIERGRELPQMIPNQTQFLKVVDIAPGRIVLGWLDVETGELTGKTHQILYDLSPSVTYVLQGQVGPDEEGAVRQPEMGVLWPNRGRQPSNPYAAGGGSR